MGAPVTDVTVAHVMIKTALGEGTAERVASEVSGIPGVHRTILVTGDYDVIAIVLVDHNVALGQLVTQGIHGIEGVTETATAVMASWYQEGEVMSYIDNGPP